MCANQLVTSLRTGEKMKKAKPDAVSAVLTSNNAHESVGWKVPSVLSRKADPKTVASIILGGGPGTHLFPLTKRSATPATQKKKKSNDMKYDILGWVILAVGIVAWVRFAKLHPPPPLDK